MIAPLVDAELMTRVVNVIRETGYSRAFYLDGFDPTEFGIFVPRQEFRAGRANGATKRVMDFTRLKIWVAPSRSDFP